MIVSPEQMKKIEEFAFEKAKDLDYNHNKDHVIRTVKLAEIIARKEGADLEICRVAAYLHDIGQSVQCEGHEERSGKMTREFLKTLKLPEEFIENVCHAIICHKNVLIKNAKTIEAKVLFDADKMQVAGTFGFCRIFSEFTAFKKLSLKETMAKCKEIQEDRIDMFQTKTAREIMKKPHEFMKEFFKLYDKWDKVEL